MTRMAQERDSILRIRAKVDSYDELKETQMGTEETLENPEAAEDRIKFCSVEKALRVRHLAEIISHEVSIQKFTSRLAKFLRATTGEDITEQRLNVCSVCAIYHFSHEEPAQIFYLLDSSISICTSEVCLLHECCTQV
jgi:hypothetical protein